MENKKSIVEALRGYIEQKGGQNKAAASIKGVSAATVSQMLNGNWELISEEMWRKVKRAVGMSDKLWATAETITYKQIHLLLEAAQEESRVMSLTAPAGSGKTYAARMYEANHRDVYLLTCDEFWSKNDFVEELLRAMGERSDGMTKRERMMMACSKLAKKDSPLIVLDEFDKLSDTVWFFFITLYNKLEDQCGIVLLSTDYIEKRIRTGLKWQKKGYPEIWSRLGSKCVGLSRCGYDDIRMLCEYNGVRDDAKIEDIVRSSEGDLRRVRQLVFAQMRKEK